MGTLLMKNIENTMFEGDRKDRLPESLSYANKEEKIQASGRMKEIYENILYCINDKNIYLDTNISLSNFSLLLCTNATYLSKTINTFFKCNLKTLLNKYRVEYAKELLKINLFSKSWIKSLQSSVPFLSSSSWRF